MSVKSYIKNHSHLFPGSFGNIELWPLIINYHSISGVDYDRFICEACYRTEETFEEDIRYFTETYEVIGLEQLFDVLSGNGDFKNKLLVTIDDGLRTAYDIMTPILMHYNVPAILFLNTAFIDNRDLHFKRKANLILGELMDGAINLQKMKRMESLLREHKLFNKGLAASIQGIKYTDREVLDTLAEICDIRFDQILSVHKPYLTSGQIKTMINSGLGVGSHSVDHPEFTGLTIDEQVFQAISSAKTVSDRFGQKYKLFSFPYNDLCIGFDFFRKMAGKIDLTFGNAGLMLDETANHFQRVGIENYQMSARQALRYLNTIYRLKKILNRGRIVRK